PDNSGSDHVESVVVSSHLASQPDTAGKMSSMPDEPNMAVQAGAPKQTRQITSVQPQQAKKPRKTDLQVPRDTQNTEVTTKQTVEVRPQLRSPTPPKSAVPDINMTGHLHSSSPAQSFILVNGRIYHEGQRLEAGPAIVRIDQNGAVLN